MSASEGGSGSVGTPAVSVVIPCYNGRRTLGRQLAALAAQETSAPFEVVVADNASTDGSGDVVRGLDDPRFRVVDASAVRGINHARNRGVQESRGELILFCDADDVVHPGWVEAYRAAHAAGAALMGGPLRRVDDDGGNPAWQRALSDNLRFLPWATGANCAVARVVLEECGPLDESFRGGGDETEFFWRAQLAGFPLVLVEGASIDYVRRPSVRGTVEQYRAFGRSHVALFERFRRHGMPRENGLGSVRTLARWLVMSVVRRDQPQHRVAVRAQLGLMLGRAGESLRRRTFYL